MPISDSRMPIIRKIVEGMISKSLLNDAKVLVMSDNTIIVFIDDTFMYTVKMTEVEPGYTFCFYYPLCKDLPEDQYIPVNSLDRFRTEDLLNTYNFYKSVEFESGLLVSIDNDLRNNEEYEKLLSLKSGDGMKFFKMPCTIPGIITSFLVPVFNGLPNLNKSDNIGMRIYKITGTNYLLNIMDIYKKKINKNINIYFRTIDIERKIMY